MRNQIREFFEGFSGENTLGLTFSIKQNESGEWLDKIKAQQNFRHFMNLLNTSAFGNGFRRYNKRIAVLPALETSYSGRLHYHAAIKSPRPDQQYWFEHEVRKLWLKTRWGYSEIHIHRSTDDGWVRYITKLHNSDEVDWENAFKAC